MIQTFNRGIEASCLYDNFGRSPLSGAKCSLASLWLHLYIIKQTLENPYPRIGYTVLQTYKRGNRLDPAEQRDTNLLQASIKQK